MRPDEEVEKEEGEEDEGGVERRCENRHLLPLSALEGLVPVARECTAWARVGGALGVGEAHVFEEK